MLASSADGNLARKIRIQVCGSNSSECIRTGTWLKYRYIGEIDKDWGKVSQLRLAKYLIAE